MATAVKRKLSSSTNGRGIKITATATAGTTVHTAVAGTTAGTYDELWLWLYNSHTADVLCTVEMGGTTAPDDNIKVTVPFKSGVFLAVPGLILQNGLTVAVFAASADVITAYGYVNAITD